MYKQILIWSFMTTIFTVTDAIKENCSEDLLQKCSRALQVPVLSSPDISFALSREELDNSCVDLRAGIKCIEDYTEECMVEQERKMFLKTYSGIRDVIRELCSRGSRQDEYLKHAECMKNSRIEYETCSRRFEGTLTALSHPQEHYNVDPIVREEHLRTVCCSVQEYLMCSEQTVLVACGEEAALFTSAFLKRMTSTITKQYCLEYRGQECGLPGASPLINYSSILLASTAAAHVAVEYLLSSLLT